jgi:hypothetical protein
MDLPVFVRLYPQADPMLFGVIIFPFHHNFFYVINSIYLLSSPGPTSEEDRQDAIVQQLNILPIAGRWQSYNPFNVFQTFRNLLQLILLFDEPLKLIE